MSSQTDTKPVEKEIITQVQNNTEQANNVQATEVETQPKNSKEWDAFKLARKAERDKAEEMAIKARKSQEEAAALKAALDAVLSKPAQQPKYNDEDIEESEEQRIDKRVNEVIARREMEAEKIRKEKEERELPQRLTNDFKDFERVCSSENLDYLDYHYPEVSRAFEHMPQNYEKWASIYKAVKRLIPNPDSVKDQSKADKNFNKPQSISTGGGTQSGSTIPPFKLDEKRKAENYARMRKVMSKID